MVWTCVPAQKYDFQLNFTSFDLLDDSKEKNPVYTASNDTKSSICEVKPFSSQMLAPVIK